MKLVGSKRAVRSPEFHKQKEWERKLKASVFSVLLLFIIFLPFYLVNHDYLLIDEVVIEGAESVSEDDLKTLVERGIEGKYLALIPRRSALFYPEDKLTQEVLKESPVLASASLSLSGLDKLVVSVEEREAELVYCNAGEECFFVDKTGFVYLEAPEFTRGVYLVIRLEPDVSLPIGQSVVDEREIQTLKEFVSRLSVLGLKTESIKKSEYEYTLLTIGGTELIWSRDKDLDALYIDIESFLKSPDLKGGDIDNLAYINFSVDNKVYFDFKD